MKKILKITISVFMLTLLVSSFRACALHQVAVNDVSVPILKNLVTAKRATKDSYDPQKFQTSVCKVNGSGEDALVEVRTYRTKGQKYSDFSSVPKNQTVTIRGGSNTDKGYEYALEARNTVSIWKTVNFWGIWLIN